jgi:hypothetical protein
MAFGIGMEIGCGDMVWTSLESAPTHIEGTNRRRR